MLSITEYRNKLNSVPTQKIILVFAASFVGVFGTERLLRTYTSLYSTTSGNLITALGLGLFVGLVVWISEKFNF